MKSGVYWIVSPSGKAYIGSSQNIEQRWRDHRCDLRYQRHHAPGLQHAANKYGMDALVFQVLEYCPVADLIAREQWCIDQFDFRTLYNVALVAGSPRGVIHSAATRAAISAANRGRPKTARAKQAVADAVHAARNTSGYKGVSRKATRWIAYAQIDGKHRSFGSHATRDLAYTWRLAMLANLEYAQ